MMDHRTLAGFRRDQTLRGRQMNRQTMRRVLGYVRPYRAMLIGFVIAVVIDAVVTAIPPLLPRSLIDTALPEHSRSLVAILAATAVALAFADAFLSLLQRWFSARMGEGLIYDMRVQLFDHVQRMPISFFTRTQTGALQTRLNNDVIGAQQAVTSTLGTVVSNVINITVVLTIMLRLEWRLTLLTLAVLPFFIWPARRMGPRMQDLTREGMQLNAEMNNLKIGRAHV